jgi:hypothetical protein
MKLLDLPRTMSGYYRRIGLDESTFEGHVGLNNSEIEFLKYIISNKNTKNVMEIGFNAGHSADLFLSSNPDIHLTSFDLGQHSYLHSGKEYIDTKYPGRHRLILGDSRETIPEFYKTNTDTRFDLIFIDGGHELGIPESDLSNCRFLAHRDTIVIMNDTHIKDPKRWNIEPNESWAKYCKNGWLTNFGSVDFSDTHGLSFGKYRLHCEFFILSMMRDDRKQARDKNAEQYPSFRFIQSVDGYNIEETLQEFRKLGVIYKYLYFPTYGTLANWLTKVKMIKYQIDHKIPYICTIEDDLILEPGFEKFVYDNLYHLNDDTINIVRLAKWGEGYITSYESAKRIWDIIERTGIVDNIDNQFRVFCGKEVAVENTPFSLMVESNKGDCLRTQQIDLSLVL